MGVCWGAQFQHPNGGHFPPRLCLDGDSVPEQAQGEHHHAPYDAGQGHLLA